MRINMVRTRFIRSLWGEIVKIVNSSELVVGSSETGRIGDGDNRFRMRIIER